MNKLILNENVTMSSREIAQLANKNHSHVLRDIKVMITNLYGLSIDDPFLDHELNQYVRYERDDRGYISNIYLDMEHSLCLTSGYSVKQRMAIIKRWKELEDVNKKPSIPQTLPEALRLAADLAEQNYKQQLVIEQQKPAVDFVDNYVKAEGNYNFRQVAKLLNAKDPELKLFLIENGIIYYTGKTMTPYQRHIDAGRFVVKTGVSDTEHACTQMKFTSKGFNWISELWANRLGEVA